MCIFHAEKKSHRKDSFLVFPPPNTTPGIFSPLPWRRHDGTSNHVHLCSKWVSTPARSHMHQGASSLAAKAEQRLSGFGYGPCLFLWSVCKKAPCCSQVSALVCRLCYSAPWSRHCSFVPSLRCLFLASALVTVYSNHRMLGMRLVSRIKKNSEIGHAAILGKRGVRISCVKANQAMAMMLPATPPYRTWLQVW